MKKIRVGKPKSNKRKKETYKNVRFGGLRKISYKDTLVFAQSTDDLPVFEPKEVFLT